MIWRLRWRGGVPKTGPAMPDGANFLRPPSRPPGSRQRISGAIQDISRAQGKSLLLRVFVVPIGACHVVDRSAARGYLGCAAHTTSWGWPGLTTPKLVFCGNRPRSRRQGQRARATGGGFSMKPPNPNEWRTKRHGRGDSNWQTQYFDAGPTGSALGDKEST